MTGVKERLERNLLKVYRALTNPELAYMLLSTTGEFCEHNIQVSEQRLDFWDALKQLYGSNRRKGYSRAKSICMSLQGYGCYKGWEVPKLK